MGQVRLRRLDARRARRGCEMSLHSSISTLTIPSRLKQQLHQAGYPTLGDLVALTPTQVLAIPGVGKKSLNSIVVHLGSLGLSLDLATTGEKPPKIEVTTPPQVGAPDAKAPGGSALQSRRQLTCYTYNRPLYAIYTTAYERLVWEIAGRFTIKVGVLPEFVKDFFNANELKPNHLYVCVRLRSFLGFVDKLVPVMSKDVDNSRWLVGSSIEDVVNDALFN